MRRGNHKNFAPANNTLTNEPTVSITTINFVSVSLSHGLTGNMADNVITNVAADAENTA
jgi:hypothetical protein